MEFDFTFGSLYCIHCCMIVDVHCGNIEFLTFCFFALQRVHFLVCNEVCLLNFFSLKLSVITVGRFHWSTDNYQASMH